MKVEQLREYGIPDGVIDIWVKEEGDSLLPIQEEAVSKHDLLIGGDLLVSAPTSSGKTFIGEIAACYEAFKGGRVIYLVPLRAVAEEKFENFTSKYGEYGVRILISTSDHRDNDESIRNGDYDIAVVVFEKLLSLSVSSPQVLDMAGLVVVDECQMISNASRGPRLEILMTKILSRKQRPRLLCLSAVANETGGLEKWIGASLLQSKDRPIELREGVVGTTGEFRFREWNSGDVGREQLSSPADNKEDLLVAVCMSSVEKNEQVVVFAATPDDTVRTVESLLNRGVDAGRANRAIQEIGQLESSEVIEQLEVALAKGVAFHNGDMMLGERLLVEKYFRQGEIRVICATSTLAMGVNLPAKNVVVEPTRWGQQQGRWARENISVADYRNMGGRAGRLRLNDDYGRSILLAVSQFERDQYWGNYVRGRVERLVSRLGEGELEDICLNLISSGICDSAQGLTDFVLSSFWGFTHEAGKDDLLPQVEEAVKFLLSSDLLETKENSLHATVLGEICASKGVPVESFSYLISWARLLLSSEGIDELEALIATSLTPSVLRNRFPMPGNQASRWNEEIRQKTEGETITASLGFVLEADRSTYELGKGCKLALVLEQWIHGEATRRIEQSLEVRGGVVRNIAGVVSWIVDTCEAIGDALGASETVVKQLNVLSHSLAYGLPFECVGLARLRIEGVHRGILMQLHGRGMTDPDTVVEQNPSDLPMPRQVAVRLQEAIIQGYDKSLRRVMAQHTQRLRTLGLDEHLVRALYEDSDTDLELRVQDLFDAGLGGYRYERITRQRQGEPDGLLHLPEGRTIVVSVSASDKKISSKKAEEVLGAAGNYSGVVGSIVIGRPDFHELAIQRADGISTNILLYKLLPISVLAEMWVRLREGRLSNNNIDDMLLSHKGHLTMAHLEKYEKAESSS